MAQPRTDSLSTLLGEGFWRLMDCRAEMRCVLGKVSRRANMATAGEAKASSPLPCMQDIFFARHCDRDKRPAQEAGTRTEGRSFRCADAPIFQTQRPTMRLCAQDRTVSYLRRQEAERLEPPC